MLPEGSLSSLTAEDMRLILCGTEQVYFLSSSCLEVMKSMHELMTIGFYNIYFVL